MKFPQPWKSSGQWVREMVVGFGWTIYRMWMIWGPLCSSQDILTNERRLRRTLPQGLSLGFWKSSSRHPKSLGRVWSDGESWYLEDRFVNVGEDSGTPGIRSCWWPGEISREKMIIGAYTRLTWLSMTTKHTRCLWNASKLNFSGGLLCSMAKDLLEACEAESMSFHPCSLALARQTSLWRALMWYRRLPLAVDCAYPIAMFEVKTASGFL